MDKAIEKFDPAQLMNGVRDRIKATFISLIPESEWEKLIQTEIDRFFTQKTINGYRNSYEFSEFTQLCQNVINEETKTRIIAYLSGKEFGKTWDTRGQPVVSATIKKLLIDNSGEIFASMIGSSFMMALDNFKRSLENAGVFGKGY